jgi:hypothetical protein
VPDFKPEGIFRVLSRHKVRYVLIGGLAATLHGSNLRTGDVDICPARDRENLNRLGRAMKQLRARVRAPDAPEGLSFAADARFFERVQICNLVTKYGDLDISFQPSGTAGFDELAAHAVSYRLGKLVVPTASLDDLIRSKEAANRPKDHQTLPALRTLRLETERAGQERRPRRRPRRR